MIAAWLPDAPAVLATSLGLDTAWVLLESHGLPPGMLAPVRWAIASRVRDVIGQDLADLQEFIERPPA